MTRWLVLLLLCCAGMFLAGCDAQESVFTDPASSPPGNEGEVGTPAAPPPPPPPPPGIGGSNIPAPAGSATVSGRLDAAFEEMIAVMNRVSDLLSSVTDEASAKAAAPKYVPLVQRREELMREIAVLRLQSGGEDGQVARKYSTRVKAAAEKVAAGDARLLRDGQMMMTWAKALRAVQQASPPVPSAPAGQGGANSPAQQFVALQQEMAANIKQIVDLLSTVNDEASARDAAPKLRQCAGDIKRSAKKMKLAMVSLSPQDLQRAIAELRDSAKDTAQLSSRMEDEIVRVAAGPAAGAIGAEINELLDALDSGVAPPGTRQRLEKNIQRARGGR